MSERRAAVSSQRQDFGRRRPRNCELDALAGVARSAGDDDAGPDVEGGRGFVVRKGARSADRRARRRDAGHQRDDERDDRCARDEARRAP